MAMTILVNKNYKGYYYNYSDRFYIAPIQSLAQARRVVVAGTSSAEAAKISASQTKLACPGTPNQGISLKA